MKKIPIFGIKEFQEGAQDALFYANDLKAHLESHRFINAPHGHSSYIAVLFTKGQGIHTIDFETYPVSRGSVFLMNPGQIHCWELSADTEGYVFFHTAAFYNDPYLSHKIESFPFFFLSQNYPLVLLDAHAFNAVEALFKNIYEECTENLILKQLKIWVLVNLVYIELSRCYKETSIHRESENHIKVRKLLKLIDINFKTIKMPKDYADMMCMSTRHLSRICNEALGNATSELIHERIILEAKRLLIHGHQSVATIAFELGYEDVSYFIRTFKGKTGLSPKDFRHSELG